jgi:hypothetical protein
VHAHADNRNPFLFLFGSTQFVTTDGGAHWHTSVEVGGTSEDGSYSCLEDLSVLSTQQHSAGGSIGLLWETSEQNKAVVGSSISSRAPSCTGNACAIVFSRISPQGQ